MSSAMRNFMEAYGAIYDTEAKGEYYSKKDELSEMDFTLISDEDLVEIAEEALGELFEEGYGVEEASAIFEELIAEAKVSYGHDTQSPRAKKVAKMKASFRSAVGKAKEKASRGAVKSYGAYRGAKQAAQDKARRTAQTAKNVSAQTARKAKEAKAKVKTGLKGMIKKAAERVASGASKVAARMESKNDSYLETDMKKRRKNNEKAVEDMKKVKDNTVPRWMKEGKKADKDYDGDGKIESGTDEYMGSRDKAIKKAMAKKGVKEDKDPCWDSHKQVGMKKKGGKMVPNCVPKGKTTKEDVQFSETELKKIQEIVDSWED